MLTWAIEELPLELKFPWAIARSTESFKKNFLIKLSDGTHHAQSEVAFNRRYGETYELIYSEFQRFSEDFLLTTEIQTPEHLVHAIDELRLPASLRCGIETAFLSYVSSVTGKHFEEILGLSGTNAIYTSFSLPIAPARDLEKIFIEHQLGRFRSLKLKVNADNALETVRFMRKLYDGPLRIDGNESWKDVDQLMNFLQKIVHLGPIDFIEQPLPANQADDYLVLKEHSPLPIFADESLTVEEVTSFFKDRFHGVNIKLMKAGGILKAMRQIRQARSLGLKVMLGCMIESSLGISFSLPLASIVDYCDLDGPLLLKKDPFGLIIEEKGKLFPTFFQ